MAEEQQASTFQKKLSNFWYYYKYYVMIGVFLLIMVFYFAHDVLGREVFDASVLMACDSAMTQEQADQMAQKMETYVGDYDGKQGVNIDLMLALYPKDMEKGNPNEVMAASTKMSAAIETDTYIFIVDPERYQLFEEGGLLTDLTEIVPGLQLEDPYGMPLEDSDLAAGMENLPENLKICMKRQDRVNGWDKEKNQEFFAYQKDLLKGILLGN